jgi:two-component system, LytTR family, response regulator AlgR
MGHLRRGGHRNCLVARTAVGGFERGESDGEAGWVVLIATTGERLPVSRRQQHVVKEFG